MNTFRFSDQPQRIFGVRGKRGDVTVWGALLGGRTPARAFVVPQHSAMLYHSSTEARAFLASFPPEATVGLMDIEVVAIQLIFDVRRLPDGR